LTLEVLRLNELPDAGYRSKSWDEFSAPEAPAMDFVLTLCDDVAGDDHPSWPGDPLTAHWMPIPVMVASATVAELYLFLETLTVLRRRIERFASLPLEKVNRMAERERRMLRESIEVIEQR
jgi:arsenate reductase (thioredoxin)